MSSCIDTGNHCTCTTSTKSTLVWNCITLAFLLTLLMMEIGDRDFYHVKSVQFYPNTDEWGYNNHTASAYPTCSVDTNTTNTLGGGSTQIVTERSFISSDCIYLTTTCDTILGHSYRGYEFNCNATELSDVQSFKQHFIAIKLGLISFVCFCYLFYSCCVWTSVYTSYRRQKRFSKVPTCEPTGGGVSVIHGSLDDDLDLDRMESELDHDEKESQKAVNIPQDRKKIDDLVNAQSVAMKLHADTVVAGFSGRSTSTF